ncbi:MAG: sigma-70 family RNA polymerase sigma factor [Verrucomicrobiota bacterium]
MQDASELPSPDELRSRESATSEKAWRQAYPIFWKLGMKVASLKLAGEARQQDREDCVQLAIVQLRNGLLGVRMDGSDSEAKSFDSVTTIEHLRNLYYRVLRARITDVHRKTAAIPENLEPESEETAPSPNEPMADEIWPLVAKLKPPKPELIEAKFILGLTTDEMARSFAMSRNTVLSHLRRGLITLKKLLEEAENPSHA